MPCTRSQRSAIIAAALDNNDLLSRILNYALSDTREVPVIALVSRHWNDVVNVNVHTSQSIWYNICVVQNPEILRIYDLCSESKTCVDIAGGGYKRLLYRTSTSSFKPTGANKQLQRSLELVFKQEGILAFTTCCSRCKGAYIDCKDYTPREHGIHFFTFFLSGGNYDSDRYDDPMREYFDDTPIQTKEIFASYTGLDYILENWETECEIIRRFCAVVGVTDYTIEKPESIVQAIPIRFTDAIKLEEEQWSSDDEDENFDY